MSDVEQHYDAAAQREWERLERFPMEFALTLRALGDYLPPSPARVLDAGGGPGRYAIALARRDYSVTLLDPSRQCLALAARQAAAANVALAGSVHGDARDLARFADGAFDAVLLLGPLYHLLTAADRQRALREARRVPRPGGVFCAALLTRYALSGGRRNISPSGSSSTGPPSSGCWRPAWRPATAPSVSPISTWLIRWKRDRCWRRRASGFGR